MPAELIFDEATHAYLLDGQLIPSVTQVLQCAGLSDYSGVPPYILDRAAWIGEETHRACQFIDEGDFDMSDLFPEIRPYVEAYCSFKAEKKFKPELVEHRGVGSVDSMPFGFCVDRVGDCGHGRIILDLKTSSKPQPSWALQLAGYALGINDTDAYRFVVRLKKDATYEVIEYSDPLRVRDTENAEVFTAALRIAWWRMMNGHKLKL